MYLLIWKAEQNHKNSSFIKNTFPRLNFNSRWKILPGIFFLCFFEMLLDLLMLVILAVCLFPFHLLYTFLWFQINSNVRRIHKHTHTKVYYIFALTVFWLFGCLFFFGWLVGWFNLITFHRINKFFHHTKSY